MVLDGILAKVAGGIIETSLAGNAFSVTEVTLEGLAIMRDRFEDVGAGVTVGVTVGVGAIVGRIVGVGPVFGAIVGRIVGCIAGVGVTVGVGAIVGAAIGVGPITLFFGEIGPSPIVSRVLDVQPAFAPVTATDMMVPESAA